MLHNDNQYDFVMIQNETTWLKNSVMHCFQNGGGHITVQTQSYLDFLT